MGESYDTGCIVWLQTLHCGESRKAALRTYNVTSIDFPRAAVEK